MGSAFSCFSAALSSFRHPAADSAGGDAPAAPPPLAAAWSALASPQQNAASTLAGTVGDYGASMPCLVLCHPTTALSTVAERPRLDSGLPGRLPRARGEARCTDRVEVPGNSTLASHRTFLLRLHTWLF